MTESLRKNLLQMVLPGAILFGALAYMHGPGYLAFAKQKVLAYTMQRDSWWGPIIYDVRLKQAFNSDDGDECMVYLLTDKAPEGESAVEGDKSPESGKTDKHEKILLVNKFGEVVDWTKTMDVGPIRSSYLMPRDGYAMLEIVHRLPEMKNMTQIVQFKITGDRIAKIGTETKEFIPEEDYRAQGWHGPHRFSRHPAWSRNSDGEANDSENGSGRRFQRPDWTPEQWRAWRERVKARNNRKKEQPMDVAKANTGSLQEENVKRSRSVSSDDQGLLNVGGLGGTRDEATEMVTVPN